MAQTAASVPPLHLWRKEAMKERGTPTKYPGVFKLENRKFRVRGKVTDPRTGKPREADRILTDVSAQAAARERAEILREMRAGANWASGKVKVGEYAKSWMRSKALKSRRHNR